MTILEVLLVSSNLLIFQKVSLLTKEKEELLMKKLIITGTFGTMLCLSTGAPADASIVSRGFLDEVLTDYATTTTLDLKANQ